MQYLTLLATMALQAYAALHAMHRGYSLGFAALIFFTPVLGPIAYFSFELGPPLYYSTVRLIKRLRQRFYAQPSPFKELTRLQRQVHHHPTSENQHRLARLYNQIGQFDEAIMLIDNVLSQKAFAHCPQLLLDKAQAYFAMEAYDKTKETLELLTKQNATNHCVHVQLLLARTLSAMGEWQLANREFESLHSRYHGLEASFYYLQHLRKLDNKPRAIEVLNHMRQQLQRLPQHYRSSQKAWLKRAERDALKGDRNIFEVQP